MTNWGKLSVKLIAARVSQALIDAGIDVTLVGGAVVTIYSDNHYQSYDLDFITYKDQKRVAAVLESLGFFLEGKYYKRSDCSYFIEFVNPPVSIGGEAIDQFKQIKTSCGQLKLLTPTDCVKDRLAAYYHWGDLQALEQALLVAEHQKINLSDVKRWSSQEGCLEKFKEFEKVLKAH